MKRFDILVDKLLSEMAANVAGGVGAVTGPTTSGNYGNQFPSQNDSAYAQGDARVPSILGSKTVKGKRKRKKNRVLVQRRSIYLPGM
jgi:hypothetical protein